MYRYGPRPRAPRIDVQGLDRVGGPSGFPTPMHRHDFPRWRNVLVVCLVLFCLVICLVMVLVLLLWNRVIAWPTSSGALPLPSCGTPSQSPHAYGPSPTSSIRLDLYFLHGLHSHSRPRSQDAQFRLHVFAKPRRPVHGEDSSTVLIRECHKPSVPVERAGRYLPPFDVLRDVGVV